MRVLRTIIQESYRTVLGDLDLERATLGQLSERFEEFGAKIEQLSPIDATGKDVAAIKAEAEVRKDALDRIERLLETLGLTVEEMGDESQKGSASEA